jgi:transaldolase
MKISIYYDGSNESEILDYNNTTIISGFTTNPSLMRQAGVTNYTNFIRSVTNHVKDKPISFEVCADDMDEMYRQAEIIASYGQNIYVKIPIVNTKNQTTKNLIKKLLDNHIMVNITAVMTQNQIESLLPYITSTTNVIVSIFAGRICDTGRNPKSIIKFAKKNLPQNAKILWASTREIYNIYEADELGCDIITVTEPLLKKFITLQNKNLDEYSLETVKMFYNDAIEANYII